MSNQLEGLAKEAKVIDLHLTVENVSGKYLCFTKVSDGCLVLCVTDGIDVWRYSMDDTELDAQRDMADIKDLLAFLIRIRSSFSGGHVDIQQMGLKVTMCLGQGNQSLSFDLFEAKAAEKKMDLQNVLFRLADKINVLESDLKTANQTIEIVKQQKSSGNTSGLLDLDLGSKKKTAQQKSNPVQKVGMSVINPGSKKRKAAQGVVFD